jgi:hypothetical protein
MGRRTYGDPLTTNLGDPLGYWVSASPNGHQWTPQSLLEA